MLKGYLSVVETVVQLAVVTVVSKEMTKVASLELMSDSPMADQTECLKAVQTVSWMVWMLAV